MLERFNALLAELAFREKLATGDYKAFYGDRKRMVVNWIEDIQNGWPIDIDYACTCATEFERMCGMH